MAKYGTTFYEKYHILLLLTQVMTVVEFHSEAGDIQ